ncbi:MAG: ribulokinase [Planctomycetota bacterium]
MAERFALGLDFGTESVRALIVEVRTGQERGRGAAAYAHGVITERLANGREPLPVDFALQHPQDYLDSARAAIADAVKDGVPVADVIGIGIDFTACTMLPTDRAGRPLCEIDRFRDEPHAFVKLWKHHGAVAQADRINRLAHERGEAFLARYGGTTSSEWLLAKALETLERAPHVYQAADTFVEASDWVAWRLTGVLARGACAAGYKGLWHKRTGHPGAEFLAALDPRLREFFSQQARGPVTPAGVAVGALRPEMARWLGLEPGTPVSAPIIDAHAAVPGCGARTEGQLVIILGTSNCHMLLGSREVLVQGIQGVVEDGILPGWFGYEAGQAAAGDLFAWFVQRLAGGDGHAELERRARTMAAGGTGLLALDWWNGNRSVLVNPRLSGMIVGLTLATRTEDIYRTLLEASAFGTRKIIDTYERAGVPVRDVLVCGGMAEKNQLLLEILASVLDRPLRRAAAQEVCARGAAIFGAWAAGPERCGHASLESVITAMAAPVDRVVLPQSTWVPRYEELYAMYGLLHDHFGRNAPAVMEDCATCAAALEG